MYTLFSFTSFCLLGSSLCWFVLLQSILKPRLSSNSVQLKLELLIILPSLSRAGMESQARAAVLFYEFLGFKSRALCILGASLYLFVLRPWGLTLQQGWPETLLSLPVECCDYRHDVLFLVYFLHILFLEPFLRTGFRQRAFGRESPPYNNTLTMADQNQDLYQISIKIKICVMITI